MQKLTSSIVVSLGLLSFVSCFTAEFMKSKKEDVRWKEERYCYIPGSRAFGLGTAALLCLVLAQIIGNIYTYRILRARHKAEDGSRAADPAIPGALLFLSWASFAAAVMLLSTAASMSRTQVYGKGWLDEECYLVKDGVFAASACLTLLAVGALILAATKANEKKPVERSLKTLSQETREQDQTTMKKPETVLFLVEEANLTTDTSRI